MTTTPDFGAMTDAELFVLARLAQLQESGFGPMIPMWAIELPLAASPYRLEGAPMVEVLMGLMDRGLIDAASSGPESSEPEPETEGTEEGTDDDAGDAEEPLGGPAVAAAGEKPDASPEAEQPDTRDDDDSPPELAATDLCMEHRAALAAEIRRRSPHFPDDIPALLLLSDANDRCGGMEIGDIRHALEEPPACLSHADGAARYRYLMEEGWLFYCERPQTSTEWFPAAKTWAHGEGIVAALRARRTELRARLAAGVADSLGLPPGSPIREALGALDREAFVPEEFRDNAYRNKPAPIWTSADGAHTVTTSAPNVCAMIASTLELNPGDRVLVCGAKGGFTTGLCAAAVGPRGRVYCLDDRAEIVEIARAAVDRAGLSRRVDFRLVRDVTVGLDDQEPWDAVVVNGKIPKVPRPIIRQMREGGRMLLFVQNTDDHAQTAYLVRKNGSAVENRSLSTFMFTPIYGEYGFDPPNWPENLSLVAQEAHDVFVSYSTRNQAECSRVVEAIESAGIRCWFSGRDHPVGKDGYETAIMDALRKAQLVLILLSHDAVQSLHVQNELTNATNLRKAMLPVKLEECPMRLPASFQYHLERHQQFDVLQHSMEKIVGAALTLLGVSAPASPRAVSEPALYRREAMEDTMELVLRDGRITRTEMQLLLEQAKASCGPIADETLVGEIVSHAREICPTVRLDP